jgi:hypothetical protein
MAITYPSTLDSFTNPSWGGTLGGEWHSTIHANCYDALEALEAKVWVNNSAVTSSLDYKVSNTASVSPWHKHNPSDIAQSGATIGQALLWNGSEYAPWTPAGGWNVTWPWASVDSEIALYSWPSWTSLKRMTGTGLVKSTSWIGSIATPWIDYAQAWTITWSGNTMSTNKVLGRSTAWTGAIEELSVSGSGNVVLATWATTTNQTLTTPTINVGSDANGDMYYRSGGTTARLAKGSSGDFLTSNGTNPVWDNPFAYEWTLNIATANSNGGWVNASTHYQTSDMTVGTVALTRGTSWYAKVRYSPDNVTWTDIYSISTAWSNTFPLLMRKGYWYYVEVDSPVWWTASQASLTALF